jgi:gluconokinase
MPDQSIDKLPQFTLPEVSVLMGVCGCGKTEVGLRLAAITGGVFHDGDNFHLPENVAKMSRGEPLDDVDRIPWLERIRSELIEPVQKGAGPVFVGCSALRRAYRDLLTKGVASGRVCLVHLSGSRELILSRMRARQGHFMKEEMVDSQFATLEEPGADESFVTVSIEPPVEQVARNVIEALKAARS